MNVVLSAKTSATSGLVNIISYDLMSKMAKELQAKKFMAVIAVSISVMQYTGWLILYVWKVTCKELSYDKFSCKKIFVGTTTYCVSIKDGNIFTTKISRFTVVVIICRHVILSGVDRYLNLLLILFFCNVGFSKRMAAVFYPVSIMFLLMIYRTSPTFSKTTKQLDAKQPCPSSRLVLALHWSHLLHCS